MEIKKIFGAGLAWKVIALLVALLVLIPVGTVALRAFEPAGEAWASITEFRLTGYLWQTAVLVGLVVFFALLLGVPTAWLVSAHQFPGRSLWDWLLLLPIAMPGFVAATAYVDLISKLTPFFIWVRLNHGIDAFLTVQKIVPWVFAVGILSLTLYPYVYLSCRAVFANRAASALEAARLLGEGSIRIFTRVAIPMARPALVAGGSLVAMEAMNDYGVVSLFGLTPLTPGVFRAWGEGNIVSAMRLGLILMAFLGLVLTLERWQRGSRRFDESLSEGTLTRRQLRPVKSILATLLCLLPVALGFFLPVSRLITWSWNVRSSAEFAGHLEAAWNSFSLAGGTVILLLLGGGLLVAVQRALGSRTMLLTQKIGLMGYGFPSALVAVGIGAFVLAISKNLAWAAGLALSASLFGLVLAYFVRFLAVSIQPLLAGFDRLPSDFRESARTLGKSRLAALWKIDLPLVHPAILAAAMLCFVDVFKELTLTLVLRPFDFETLATRAYRFTDEGRVAEAAVPGMILTLLCLAGLLPLTGWMKRLEK